MYLQSDLYHGSKRNTDFQQTSVLLHIIWTLIWQKYTAIQQHMSIPPPPQQTLHGSMHFSLAALCPTSPTLHVLSSGSSLIFRCLRAQSKSNGFNVTWSHIHFAKQISFLEESLASITSYSAKNLLMPRISTNQIKSNHLLLLVDWKCQRTSTHQAN